MPPVSDLPTLLRSMHPVLNAGTYVFTTVPLNHAVEPSAIVASVREPEGLSVILAESDAVRHGLVPLFRCAWITLMVNSDLSAVGLTAAFAAALTDAGISCNVVAGAHHDHIFVPESLAPRAMDAMRALQRQALGTIT
jgi:uncharacterized protein